MCLKLLGAIMTKTAHRTVKATQLKFCTEMFAFANQGKYFPRVRVKL